MSIESNNEYKYDIFNFLEEHIVENGKVHSHTSMHNPRASYFIKSSELDVFYDLYEDAIINGKELHITEKRQEFFPMTIDLDFKYELETFQRMHTQIHIKKIIDLYINEIVNILNIDKNDLNLTSFVFERDESYKAKGITKDGIHIQFPFIVTYPAVQYFIRDNILKKIGDIISDMGLKNAIPDIVDRSVISPNTLWLLYGSNKDKPKGNPYKLKYIYDGFANELSIIDYFGNQNINLARFFSIRDKNESDIIPIRDDKVHLIENTNKKKAMKKVANNINYDPERIRELVFILNSDRAENYNQWLELGWAIHNIDPNSQELLDIWIDFSKKSSKFKEGECEKIWEKSKNEGLTIACIHYWAKIDNKKKYDEYKDKDISKWIDISIKTQSNYDIAYVLFKMYEYDFVFSDNDWYIYKNHVWHRENDGMSLRQKISNELCTKYAKLMSYYNEVASGKILINNQELTEEEKEEYKKKNGVVLEVIKKLKTTAFKENVMKECKELFSNKDFVKKLDANPYLIGFTNGIYDLKKGELRDGRPDDYIEMNTEIDKIDFDENHEYWFELKNFLNTVFFDEEVRNYFLTYFASCLQGHNAEEKFRIWTGIGCHAFDTDIMMVDGTTKKVQDIIVGDKIMGDDSTERNVLELKHGFSDMYEFKGKMFESFIVNGDHILCLYQKQDNILNYIEISVKNFIKLENKDIYYLFNKDKDLFSFIYSKVDNNYFYGFELDGNHCYLMGNNIVTHNSNGKSKILELFVHCLGMYSIKFPITMLTGKRAASNACTPEIVQSKGKRFGYFEEPSENERINAGLLKEFTGGDKIKARGLHKEPIEFKPQFKLALLCNEMPEVPPNDSGTWRRMEVIEFKSRFCENPKESHEFPIDKYLSEKLKNWKELFMALLLDVYYKKYKEYGIKVPLEVIKFTLEYQKQCDLYTDFISENLDETKENTDIIDITQLYDEFKVWYEDTFSNHKYPSKIEFKKYLKKRYGSKRISINEIKGFKFKFKYEKKNSETQIMQGY
jgi:P4 family phage/plasmid primase-like protien